MADDVERTETTERKRPVRVEVIDDYEIEYYKAKTMAGSGFIVDPEFAQQYLMMGKLPVFLMAFRVQDWTPKTNAKGEVFKEVRLALEEVRTLTDEVRREAMAYFAATSPEFAEEGETPHLGLPASAEVMKLQAASLQQELLEQYLGQRWGFTTEDDETPVEAAMRLLEELKDINDSAPPSLAIVQPIGAESSRDDWEEHVHGAVEPEYVDPAVADVLAELEGDDDEDDDEPVVRSAGPSFEEPGMAPKVDRSSGPIFDEPSDEPAAAAR